MFKYFSLFVFLFSSFIGHSQYNTDSFSYNEKSTLIELIKHDNLMGSTFVITAIDSSYSRASKTCQEAITYGRQIEAKISSWDENSQTSKINRYAGISPVKVDKYLFDLIARSKKISELTVGAFDISYASLDKVWDFSLDTISFPEKSKIEAAVAKINYKNIILNSQDTTVYLNTPGMKIGFGGIGKGFLADEIKKFLISKGIESGIVNAGGDLVTWGKPINDTAWDIGIANPRFKNSILGQLKIKDQAIVTSGDYEKFVFIEGKKYGHIINPITGLPSEFLNSASVICTSAELGDALATAIFVMGPEKGIELVNKLNGVEAVAIKGEEIFKSNNIKVKKSNSDTLSGKYEFFAGHGTIQLCGKEIWIPVQFKDQEAIERKYFSLKEKGRSVAMKVKGEYVNLKRESRTISIFKVTEVLRMEIGYCD